MLCVATYGFVRPFRGQFGDDDDDDDVDDDDDDHDDDDYDNDNYDGTVLLSISLIVVFFSLNLPTSKQISS